VAGFDINYGMSQLGFGHHYFLFSFLQLQSNRMCNIEIITARVTITTIGYCAGVMEGQTKWPRVMETDGSAQPCTAEGLEESPGTTSFRRRTRILARLEFVSSSAMSDIESSSELKRLSHGMIVWTNLDRSFVYIKGCRYLLLASDSSRTPYSTLYRKLLIRISSLSLVSFITWLEC
jgi:hypothetical protein